MSVNPPIPPHLQQFIQGQVAAGHFQSESDVIATALNLLESQFLSQETFHDWLKLELDKGLESPPGEPATKEYWDRLREQVRLDMAARHGS